MSPQEEIALRVHALEAIARTGLAWDDNAPYHSERYKRILELTAEIAALVSQPLAFDETLANQLKEGWLAQIKPQNEGYVTPKLGTTGAVITRGTDQVDRILLMQRRDNQTWRLPGGFCEVGISAPANVTKEIWEETGIRATPIKIFAVADSVAEKWSFSKNDLAHKVTIFYLCKFEGGEIKPDPVEALNAGFFSLEKAEELAGDLVAPTIRRAFECYYGSNEIYFAR